MKIMKKLLDFKDSNLSFSYSFTPKFYERRVNLFDDDKLGKAIYIGHVYNCKKWGDYEGSFFTISASIIKDIFGITTYIIPLNATVFSSGRPSDGKYGSYGWAASADNASGLLNITGAWSYYFFLWSF